ncbi:tetratricopeptide repeat protein [Oceanospirillum multiglobuliferum]|uniref:Uncharacterized protein n=1 Tax=Oceanospirillum multiglobuliferum TaxID=64969 RepID=A0A1V4T7K8_9GAMM|nr:hypothetical protein [Oceanospirillum multiglobuliferum]OPX56592.1 hypothetical protein BTE48_04000 [Oceanospirillum multiglobuliferum]
MSINESLKSIVPREQSGRLYQQLKSQQMACYNSADFLAYLGSVQLRTGQLSDAQDSLERALMLNPQQGLALVDYAEVLYLLRQPFAAYDLNQQLLLQTDLPEAVRTHLQMRQAQWSQIFERTDYRISLSLGHDTNLNTAADLNRLTLTDGLGTTLIVAQQDQPVSGYASDVSLSARHTKLRSNGQQYWQVNLYSRTGINVSSRHDQQQLDLTYNRSYRPRVLKSNVPLFSDWSWEVGLKQFNYNSQSLYRSLQLQFGLGQTLSSSCQLTHELQFSRQFYLIDNSSDAVELSLQPKLACHLSPSSRLFVQLGAAVNQATGQRTGGNRQQLDALIVLKYRDNSVDNTGEWSASVRQNQTQDENGYNALLDNNRPRHVDSVQYGLQYRRPIADKLSVSASVQQIEQSSNIVLFSYTATRASLGIDWYF